MRPREAPGTNPYLALVTTAFDTLKAARALGAAGVEPPQAELIFGSVPVAVSAGVATKADILKLQTDIADLGVTMLLSVFGVPGLLFAAPKQYESAPL